MGDRWNLSAPPRPSRCILLQSDQFWVVSHEIKKSCWKRSWIPSKPFWFTSFLNIGRWSAPSVLQFYHDDCHVVALSFWHSSGLRKHPIAIGVNFGWLYFFSRDVRKCNRQFLDSNKEGILSIALWELFSHNSNSFTLPMSRIVFFDFSINGL